MTFDFDWRSACMDAERRFMDMQHDRDRWRNVATALAKELGKEEYAHAAYEDSTN